MTLHEMIVALEQPYETRTAVLSDFMDSLKAGEFTREQVLEYYRQRDSPRFIAAVKLFEEGKLFVAQNQSFDGWSNGFFARQDKERAEDYLSLEDSAQQRKAEGTPANIRRFIFVRIYGARPRSDDMSSKIQEKWVAENKRFNWYWNAK